MSTDLKSSFDFLPPVIDQTWLCGSVFDVHPLISFPCSLGKQMGRASFDGILGVNEWAQRYRVTTHIQGGFVICRQSAERITSMYYISCFIPQPCKTCANTMVLLFFFKTGVQIEGQGLHMNKNCNEDVISDRSDSEVQALNC